MTEKELRIPHYDKRSRQWSVNIDDRTETGSVDYVVSEYIRDGVIYDFGDGDHVHSFEEVLMKAIEDPESFSIEGFEDQYSQQELNIINKLVQKLREDK